jgi:ferritin-like metal-binding protein YciE
MPGRKGTNGFGRVQPSEEAQHIYVVGLRNAHALEKQAIEIMERQVGRLTHYPELSRRLRSHIRETKDQLRRLDQILAAHEESSSAIKDIALQTLGNMAAISNAMAGDEILKNTFADFAFEHYEIAAYKSLIALAEIQRDQKALPLLKSSLREEEQMAAWLDENIRAVTAQYVEREQKGEQANR